MVSRWFGGQKTTWNCSETLILAIFSPKMAYFGGKMAKILVPKIWVKMAQKGLSGPPPFLGREGGLLGKPIWDPIMGMGSMGNGS